MGQALIIIKAIYHRFGVSPEIRRL